MSTAELHVMLCCSCVACEICTFVVEKLGDFGNERLENHWKALKKSNMRNGYISTGWSGCS